MSAEEYLVTSSSVQPQEENCRGIVKDSDGMPMVGVSVVVKETTNGVTTGQDGDFILLNVKKGAVLEVSFMGFVTREVRWNGDPLEIILEEDKKMLEEVVVIGFGSQKKGDVTGAISAVSGDDISRRPVANTASLLQSKVPGLSVSQGTGQPGGEDVTLRVRGQGTFSSAGSDPLVLINGVPGNMTNLDPSVIESVSVLKDAASASIYGARAANGVILITTKSGSYYNQQNEMCR